MFLYIVFVHLHLLSFPFVNIYLVDSVLEQLGIGALRTNKGQDF